MVGYMGAGSVWKSVSSSEPEQFICNYSEWRMEDDDAIQRILFARSNDLVHWHKVDDAASFRIDERFYQKIKKDPMGRGSGLVGMDSASFHAQTVDTTATGPPHQGTR